MFQNCFTELVSGSAVGVLITYLRGGIRRVATERRAEDASARVAVLTVARVAEVRQFDAHLRVEKDVLATDVPMRDSVPVAMRDGVR